jgi:hypothetical protein
MTNAMDVLLNFKGQGLEVFGKVKSGADGVSASANKMAIQMSAAKAQSQQLEAKIASLGAEVAKGEKSFDKAEKELEAFKRGMKQLPQPVEKTKSAFSALQGVFATIGFAAVGQQLLQFGKQAITAASDVEEMQSKFSTVFKDLSGSVTAELDDFATSANRSIYDLQGFAATLQDTFVPLGFARDKAADMSIELVKLAEDLASFNSLDTDTVVQDLQSALVGNTETLRKYGVVAQQAQIDQEALALGLEFTKGKMDAQTKAAAILSLTLKSTTDAQGDAIKTADSFANQMKGLKAATTELAVVFGELLLPAASAGVSILTDFAKTASTLTSQVGEIKDATENTASPMSDIAVILNEVNKAMGGIPADEFVQDLRKWERGAALSKKELAEVDDEFGNLDSSMSRFLSTADDVTETLDYQFTATERVSDAAESLSDKQLQLANQTGSTHQTVAAANLALEQQARAEEEAAVAAELLAEAQRKISEQSGDLFTQFSEAGDGAINLNEAMYQAADAAGANAEQLALLKIATGDVSEAQAEFLLKQVAIQQAVNALGEQFAAGELSLQDYATQARTAIDEINNLDFSFDLEAGEVTIPDVTAESESLAAANEKLLEAENQVAALGDASELTTEKTAQMDAAALSLTETLGSTTIGLEDGTSVAETYGSSMEQVAVSVGIAEQAVLRLNEAISQTDSGLSVPGLGSGATPTGTHAQAARGADFVVPPGYPNDSFRLGLTSGEYVQVTPAGQVNNDNSQTNSISVNVNAMSDPNSVGNAAATGVHRAARSIGMSGGY